MSLAVLLRKFLRSMGLFSFSICFYLSVGLVRSVAANLKSSGRSADDVMLWLRSWRGEK
jgi:hypothetical protein